MAYNDCYKRAMIIMERVVRMESLENTSIPEVFKERTQTKLLNPSGNVCAKLIREFFANATVEGDHINYWVQQKEFIITRDSIQEFFKVRPPSQPISIQYDDRLDSLEPMAELLGGSLKKKPMNVIPFNAKMRTLAYVMIHNLYPMMNLTTLSGPRTIFLYDLFTHKEIDICSHIYHLLTKSITKRNSRTILPFLSLIMGLIAKTKLKIPSGLTIVQRDYPISSHTVTRSKAYITGSRIGVSQIPRDDVEEEGNHLSLAPVVAFMSSFMLLSLGRHIQYRMFGSIPMVLAVIPKMFSYLATFRAKSTVFFICTFSLARSPTSRQWRDEFFSRYSHCFTTRYFIHS